MQEGKKAMIIRTLDDLEALKQKGQKVIQPDRMKITVGMATCGTATGGAEVFEKIKEEVKNQGLDAMVTAVNHINISRFIYGNSMWIY